MPLTADDTQPRSLEDPALWTEPAEPTETASSSVTPPAADASAAPSSQATTQPAAGTPGTEGGGTGHQEDTGPIPLDRHKAILEPLRAEVGTLKTEKQALSWASDLTAQGYRPEQITETLKLAHLAVRDPNAFLEHYQRTMGSDPQVAAALRSFAGRILGTAVPAAGPEAAASAAPDEPQPDLQTEDGALLYSAGQLRKWQQWNAAQLRGEFAPLIQDRNDRLQAQAAQRELSNLTTQIYDREIGIRDTLRKNALFVKHEADVMDYIAKHDYKPSLHEAWINVLHATVLPTLDAASRASVVADMRTSAVASSASPSAAASSTATRPRSLEDSSLQW